MNKVIAVLGAGNGLGMSTAFRFGREGYKIALVRRDATSLDGLVSDLMAENIEAAAFPHDLADSSELPKLLAAIRKHFGRIDVVLHNPSVAATQFVPATSLTADAMNGHLAVFLTSLIEAVQAVLPEMIERGDGAILATHGITAVTALPNFSGPGTAAAAARNYLHALNAELSGTGVYAGNLVVGGLIARGQRYRGEYDAGPALTRSDGSAVPVFDADKLADIYWSMVRRGEQPEEIPTP